MREIKLLASLEHPNIAQLRTAFTVENQLVMIMEYVQGDTLAQRLESGAFSASDALILFQQVLSALELCSCERHHSSRHQAGQHDADSPGHDQADGLRHCAIDYRSWHDRHWNHAWLARLYVARAGEI